MLSFPLTARITNGIRCSSTFTRFHGIPGGLHPAAAYYTPAVKDLLATSVKDVMAPYT
jgi:hypothetical protein